MKLNKNNTVKRMFFIFAVITLFFAAIIQVSSDIEPVKYTDMEKDEIGEDNESQEALQEYYSEILGSVKKKAKFNTIATQGDIAVLNVTINGKDSRILTRLRTATIFPTQNLLNATMIRTINLVVLGNISLKGNLFFEAEKSFGLRRLYGVGSTNSMYVDEGFARLVNGKANVSINPILSELISGYNVFLSAEGLTRGIYISEKTSSYFVVKSINSGSNVGFSWMLRGIKKELDEKLSSEFGKGKGIGIKAEINFENGVTDITITVLEAVSESINISTNINISPNNSSDAVQNNNSVNTTNNLNSNIITGNLVDEFGLETDLGNILSDTPPPLPTLGEENNDLSNNQNNNLNVNETLPESIGLENITSNENLMENGSIVPVSEDFVLEFTLQSTNEEFIVSQIADVTGISPGDARKLINFVYLEPIGFEDEVIEPLQPSLNFIEKINGSVIIRLG